MPHAVFHLLEGRPEPVRDPLTRLPLAFEEPDVGAAVAQLLADGGFVACALAPAPLDAQIVGSDEEALVVVRLLLSELRLHQGRTATTAATN